MVQRQNLFQLVLLQLVDLLSDLANNDRIVSTAEFDFDDGAKQIADHVAKVLDLQSGDISYVIIVGLFQGAQTPPLLDAVCEHEARQKVALECLKAVQTLFDEELTGRVITDIDLFECGKLALQQQILVFLSFADVLQTFLVLLKYSDLCATIVQLYL